VAAQASRVLVKAGVRLSLGAKSVRSLALQWWALPRYADLPVHSALASTLAARGYDTPTPVQAAVLEPALAGRDLLVSSQTGSGKTVAFGTLIAQTLFDPAPAEGRPPERKAPRALVVAPTRELAGQVQRELQWLFAGTDSRLAAFTGGTPVGADLGRLRRGVDLLVGTPGRLVDLHKRAALDLSALEVLVLDEADEMLDLGFKEDLEYLLTRSPAERRTLLFSATLPREIAKLASTYQRDPARVDPRPGGEASVHTDIRYVAHLLRPSDRLAAVVNVLLAAGDSKAIVFCRTRDGVGALHQKLVEHGLSATAMSGDRAQGERNRSLEALRTGGARVLVATNVAARGLDLPDVDLIVHADLPDNAEALTHRSGRTGRAGKKGVSVVMADLRERPKAERLLSAARVKTPWTAPPTPEHVRRQLEDRFMAGLLDEARAAEAARDEAAPAGDSPPGADRLNREDQPGTLEDRLRASLPERVLISVLLGRELSRLPRALPLTPVDLARRPGREGAFPFEGPAHDGKPRPFMQNPVIFRVNLGAEAKAEPTWLLPLICRRGGVTRREVGAIRIGPRSSTFEIAAEAAISYARAAREPDPRAPHVMIEPVNPEALAQPPSRVAGPRPGSPPPRPPHRPQQRKPGRPQPAGRS
jgi:ATP-dependent RNA helicase DeaD